MIQLFAKGWNKIMLKIKKKNGFSLMETLVTLVIVGILSALCGTMLIFAYNMFENIMGNGTSSIEYKMFRFKAEKIFRNMTSDGPIIMNIIDNDICSLSGTAGRPPENAAEEEACIKFDVEYVLRPYDGYVYSIKYTEKRPSNATTRYCTQNHRNVNPHNATCIDPGVWNGHVGRSVAVYSCVDNLEKKVVDYKRYLMRMEVDHDTGHKIVVLYTWPLIDDKFVHVDDAVAQENLFPFDSSELKREVLLSNVKDFQITTWPSNLYFNRIKNDNRYKDIAIVRMYVQLGKDAALQYSNDLVFANKSIYGDIDRSFYTDFDYLNAIL